MQDVLRFVWWNVDSFRHFDTARLKERGWPSGPAAYQAKCAAIDRVLQAILVTGPIDLLALAELTGPAACALRDRLLPGFKVYSLDRPQAARSRPNVAFLYDPRRCFAIRPPIYTPRTSEDTRAMAVLDLEHSAGQIRFIACHWTAFDRSHETRQRQADRLSEAAYEYLCSEKEPDRVRHLVILGDLNEEPFGLPTDRLHAHRTRSRSREPIRAPDRTRQRVHLYDCAWRLLGEQRPHPNALASAMDAAGTYYWRAERTWHTFDHVICSGSLLGPETPYLDETSICVFRAPACFDADGLPRKFAWNAGRPRGVSDHLPVMGRLMLQRSING
jgi:hypothetical protein